MMQQSASMRLLKPKRVLCHLVQTLLYLARALTRRYVLSAIAHFSSFWRSYNADRLYNKLLSFRFVAPLMFRSARLAFSTTLSYMFQKQFVSPILETPLIPLRNCVPWADSENPESLGSSTWTLLVLLMNVLHFWTVLNICMCFNVQMPPLKLFMLGRHVFNSRIETGIDGATQYRGTQRSSIWTLRWEQELFA